MLQKDLSFPLAKLRIGQSMCWINNNFYYQNNTRQMLQDGQTLSLYLEWRILQKEQTRISIRISKCRLPRDLYIMALYLREYNDVFERMVQIEQIILGNKYEGVKGQHKKQSTINYGSPSIQKKNKFNYSASISNSQQIWTKSPYNISNQSSPNNYTKQQNCSPSTNKDKYKKQIQIGTVPKESKQQKQEKSKKQAQTQTDSIDQRQKKELQKPKQSLHSNPISRQQLHKSFALFSGDVLDDEQDYKLYLNNLIQQNFHANVKRTPLLFSYHPKRNQNFHPYIDGIAPFILVAKTSSGFHIAAISQGKLDHKKHEQKRGWIISLTNRKSYPSLLGKSAISYDQVYLIFGNQQLRIQGTSLNILSNFGMSAGYYQTNGDKLRNLFGENSKEIQLQAFQIFKIQFT